MDFGAMFRGDLLLFAEPKAISHIVIYVGDGGIIQHSLAMADVTYLDLAGDRAAW